jgi:hypothetical protein
MKLRRRHFVLLAVVLMIGAPIAWRYRPLNEFERKMVGHWETRRDMSAPLLFTADRRFSAGWIDRGLAVGGQWRMDAERLALKPDPTPRHNGFAGFKQRINHMFLTQPKYFDVRFVGEQSAFINGETYSKQKHLPIDAAAP